VGIEYIGGYPVASISEGKYLKIQPRLFRKIVND